MAKNGKYLSDNGKVYLDKRTTVRLAQSAGKSAATRAMNTMGYVVTVEKGSVIKQYNNGTKEILGPVEK